MQNFSAGSVQNPGVINIDPGNMYSILAKNCGDYPVILNAIVMEAGEIFEFRDVYGSSLFQVYPVVSGQDSYVVFMVHLTRPLVNEVAIYGQPNNPFLVKEAP